MSEIVDRLVAQVDNQIAEAARAACTSRTLRSALKLERTPTGLVLSVPHYWAPFFNAGRGPVFARPGHKLVFYKDPTRDPRLAGGYPVKLSDVRRLTRAEFFRDLKAGLLVAVNSVRAAEPNEFLGRSLTEKAAAILALPSRELATELTKRAMGINLKGTVTTKLGA